MNEIEYTGWSRSELERAASLEIGAHPSLRFGQALYNVAYRQNPAIAKLAGTEFDPFSRNDQIEAFFAKIGARP